MEFNVPELAQPQQSRQVVGENVIVRAADVLGERRDHLDELGPFLIPMFLKKSLAADALGHADHREWTIAQMRQHIGRDAREITQVLALGDRGRF